MGDVSRRHSRDVALLAFTLVAAACLGGAEIGELEDQVFSDIIGKEPDPDTSRAIGCVSGSVGFFGGTGAGTAPTPVPVNP